MSPKKTNQLISPSKMRRDIIKAANRHCAHLPPDQAKAVVLHMMGIFGLKP